MSVSQSHHIKDPKNFHKYNIFRHNIFTTPSDTNPQTCNCAFFDELTNAAQHDAASYFLGSVGRLERSTTLQTCSEGHLRSLSLLHMSKWITLSQIKRRRALSMLQPGTVWILLNWTAFMAYRLLNMTYFYGTDLCGGVWAGIDDLYNRMGSSSSSFAPDYIWLASLWDSMHVSLCMAVSEDTDGRISFRERNLYFM